VTGSKDVDARATAVVPTLQAAEAAPRPSLQRLIKTSATPPKW
jgi:hypothetical protein